MRISGIVPIIPTPFQADGDVDFDAFKGLMDFAAGAGACAVCLPAYASEFYKLAGEERAAVLAAAIAHAAGRIPVIAQVNAPSMLQARRAAVRAQEMGAAAVNIGAPRLFAIPEADLFRYFAGVLEAVEVPAIVQDFNPGGATISPAFIARLHRAQPRFRYVKLEDAMLAGKVRAIREATGGEVGVIEGWGGMYLIELVRAGICACMPGLALADVLALVFREAAAGREEAAYDAFQGVLPQIVYSLQNLELFHHCEKLLLAARGVLATTVVRDATLMPSEDELVQIRFLNARVLELLGRLGLPLRYNAVRVRE